MEAFAGAAMTVLIDFKYHHMTDAELEEALAKEQRYYNALEEHGSVSFAIMRTEENIRDIKEEMEHRRASKS